MKVSYLEKMACSNYTQEVTMSPNVKKIMTYNGPRINFEIHSTRDEKDIQTALEKIADLTNVTVYVAEPFENINTSDTVMRLDKQTLPMDCLSAAMGAVLKNNPALIKNV